MNFYNELEGIFLARITPPAQESVPPSFDSLEADYERRGGTLLSSPGAGSGANPNLGIPEDGESMRFGDTLVRSLVSDEHKGIRLSYSRPILKTPLVSAVRSWGRFLCSLWLVMGCWFLFRIFSQGKIPRLSLKLQLSGVFLIAILPILLLGFLIIVQAQVENEARIESDQLNHLEKTCQTIDDGYQLCQAFSQSLLEHSFRKKELLEKLDKLPAEKTAFHLDGGGLLGNLLSRITSRGLKLRNMNLFSVNLTSATYPFEGSKADSNPMTMIMRYVCHSMGKRLSPESFQGNEQRGGLKASDLLVVGTQFEEFQKTIVPFLGVGNSLRLMQAPFYCGNLLMGVDSAESFFRKAIFINGQHRFDIQAVWRMPNLEQHLFDSWDSLNNPLHNPSPLRVLFSEKAVPSQFLVPPFFAFRPYQHEYEEISRLKLPLDLAPFASLAIASKEPLRVYSGTIGQERVTQFFPGFLLEKWLITAEVNLTRLFEPILELSRQKRLMLVLILLVCMYLAGRVANRFLLPISNLCAAAHRITQGDYQSRMDTGFSGEFGILAAAFNKMATEAQEGKLLGHFVSDSVRLAAQDGSPLSGPVSGRHDAGHAVDQQEVVILFSALGGFKDALYQHDPVDLIESLNRFLQTMSPIIRNHGGEIDKFIGDKILAVFRIPRGETGSGTGVEHAARALQAAIAMRQAMSGIVTPFPAHLGIGLVQGPVLSGILGAEEVRLEYTVIGDTVNLASRLADMAIVQAPGRTILDDRLAESLLKMPESARCIRPLATATVKGKKREVKVYEVLESPTSGG